MTTPFKPALPPYRFVPPFDPPGSESSYVPDGEDDDGPWTFPPVPEPVPPVWPDDYPPGTPDPGPRPPWWLENVIWPPQPEPPVVIGSPPPLPDIIWPRLPPDHPYHVPPGYSYPDNLPEGHPGHYYPGMPDYPVVHPGSWGEHWPSYPGILDN